MKYRRKILSAEIEDYFEQLVQEIAADKDLRSIFLKPENVSTVVIGDVKGIRLIRQKESYSSQCPPQSEEVSVKYAEKRNRKKEASIS